MDPVLEIDIDQDCILDEQDLLGGWHLSDFLDLEFFDVKAEEICKVMGGVRKPSSI